MASRVGSSISSNTISGSGGRRSARRFRFQSRNGFSSRAARPTPTLAAASSQTATASRNGKRGVGFAGIAKSLAQSQERSKRGYTRRVFASRRPLRSIAWMRVYPTRTDTARPVSGPAYYRLKLGRRSFAPEWWPSWLLLALLRLVALLPLSASRVLGAALGLLIYALNAKRRHIARVNLELCFPEKSARTHARLLRRHFMV